ncbi:hypothetical protein RM533_07580 [Croceicoccus sp. F390]|uniref:Uncharacterized protein n=1 Tax=Croceicoccus esteveae TaxID=3075597 RepID=A0ABU2ZI49_9SPHN|nr:hypothetical protein [Croceicoccus sp. F390]MDT0576046.1 hypothetical protein [Croceicoccus sp. F390]
MMLGDYLALAKKAGADVHGWLAAAGPLQARALEKLAQQEDLAPARAARMAVADFSRFAGEEDWTTLISHVRVAPDPALACLGAMIDWRLAQKPCGAHDVSAHQHQVQKERA